MVCKPRGVYQKRRSRRSDVSSPALTAMVFVCCFMLGVATSSSATGGVQAVALLKGRAMLNIDGTQKMVKVGETFAGVEVIEATPAFVRILLDGQEHRLELDGRIHTDFGEAPEKTIVRLTPGRGGHYFVDGQINGHPTRFLVDTGATSIAINKNAAKSMGLNYRVDGRRGLVETASGPADAYGVRFDEVRVRGLVARNIRGVVIESDSPREALLGQVFLNRFDLRREGPVLELEER